MRQIGFILHKFHLYGSQNSALGATKYSYTLRIPDNLHFDSMANPEDQIPSLETPPSQNPVVYSTKLGGAPDPDNNPTSSLSELADDENEDFADYEDGVDLMRVDGDVVSDEDSDDYVVFSSRACVLDPSHDGRAYFFFDNRYVSIDSKPGMTDDTTPPGSKPLVGNWPSLSKAGFGIIDAVLLNPKNRQEMYFFCMGAYALINVMPGASSSFS